MKVRAVVICVALLGTLACGTRRSAPVPSAAATLQARRNEVEAAMQTYGRALKNGRPEAVAERFAEDGELILPGMSPLHGRAAILAFLKPLVAAVSVLSVEIDTETLTINGARAEQRGAYTQVAAEGNKPPQRLHGKYIAEWQQETDRQWRLARLTMLPDQPTTR